MARLHIVQGGIENGDKRWLEGAASKHRESRSWIAPKTAMVDDHVVIFIGGYGFFATARIKSKPVPRPDWPNRYGAGLKSIRLIKPAISIATIQRHIPTLIWANYPRSITTPRPTEATQVEKLISERRKTGLPDLFDDALAGSNIDELRTVALMSARSCLVPIPRTTILRARSTAIHLYVLARAAGRCEGCKKVAPFFKEDGSAYLESHHTTRVADGGPDHPAKVIGLCPNCHRRAHYSRDAKTFNQSLVRRLPSLERRTLPQS
jgi:hypothetical protein